MADDDTRQEVYEQGILHLLSVAFGQYGAWRVAKTEPNGLGRTEHVSSGQLARIAHTALKEADLLSQPPEDEA